MPSFVVTGSFPFFTITPVIIADSPPGDVSNVDVQLVSAGGTSQASPADHFTYVPVPSVISISASLTSLAGGAALTITGSGLANATAVNFGNLQATIVSDTDNQIVVDVPQSSAYLSNVDVTVTTAGGTSATSADDQISYVPPPTVTVAVPLLPFKVKLPLLSV